MTNLLWSQRQQYKSNLKSAINKMERAFEKLFLSEWQAASVAYVYSSNYLSSMYTRSKIHS